MNLHTKLLKEKPPKIILKEKEDQKLMN